MWCLTLKASKRFLIELITSNNMFYRTFWNLLNRLLFLNDPFLLVYVFIFVLLNTKNFIGSNLYVQCKNYKKQVLSKLINK